VSASSCSLRADVVVVGGGLAGRSAALALAAAGVDTVVIEARSRVTEDAYGLLLWPNGTKTLAALGLLDAVVDVGCVVRTLRWFIGEPPEPVTVDLDRVGGSVPFVGVLPSRLEATLVREADRRALRALTGVEEWSLDADRERELRFRGRTADGTFEVRAPLAVGADGPGSQLRGELRLPVRRWQPPRQAIVTGIGGRLSFDETRQVMRRGWVAGSQSVGDGGTWLSLMTRNSVDGDAAAILRTHALADPDVADAAAELEHARVVRPASLRVARWTADRAILIGDAAHGMLPHLGLGGSSTLEDVPVLVDVVEHALRSGKTDAASLAEFQLRRGPRVAYARRASEVWALSMTSSLPGIRVLRDWNFRRLARRRQVVDAFVSELAGEQTVRLRSRLSVGLP